MYKMKIFSLLTFLTLYISLSCEGAAINNTPFEDFTPADIAELAYIREYTRPKRSGSSSGSGDILNHLKTSISQSLKAKLGMIARGSASASSHFSSSSGGHGGGHSGGYGPGHSGGHQHHDDDYKSLDIWSLKKSIFHTIFQAIRAIKGGVIAVKGQLLKGGGHLLSAKGKLISGGGEALSNLGKNIATSAFMIIPHETEYHEAPVHHEYAGPIAYSHEHSAPSGPSESFHSAPSAPGPEYGPPPSHNKHHYSLYEGKNENQPDGIVILKKIPSEQEGEESQTPNFKPLPHSAPNVKNIVGTMFSASSDNEHYNVQHEPSEQIHSKYQQPPSTNYGTPVGNSVKYNEYYNTPANTLPINKQKQLETFVTPMPADAPIIFKLDLPKQSHDDKTNFFIGMNVPLDALPYKTPANFKPHESQNYLDVKHNPFESEVQSQFIINYPDSKEEGFKHFNDNVPQPSRYFPKKGSIRQKHSHSKKPPPNFEVLRSVAFELGPHGPIKV